jgi:hypothetical protein
VTRSSAFGTTVLTAERLFDAGEINQFRTIARPDHRLAGEATGRRDGDGGVIKLSLRKGLREDIDATFEHSRRVVGRSERLLGGEVHHDHDKMILEADPISQALNAAEWDFRFAAIQPLLRTHRIA